MTAKKIIQSDNLLRLFHQDDLFTISTGDGAVTPPPVEYMTHIDNHLRFYRTRANVPQQDVAYLLNLAPSNLNRYESGERNPTPEVLLTYHILFGANLRSMFFSHVKTVEQNIVGRSTELMSQLEVDPSPKSSKRIAYLQSIVKLLTEPNHDKK